MQISVVIPTHARPRQLKRCLAALCRQTLTREQFEVIVVDDGGTLAPSDLGEFARSLSLTVVAQNPRRGPAAARNAGARRAATAALAFTDDDCAPHRDWLRVLTETLRAEPLPLLGGRVVNGLENNPYAEASQLLVSYLYDYFNTGRAAPSFFTSNNIAVSRHAFLAAGGFDETFPLAAGEDREFCHRWLAEGRSMHYVEDAVVDHYHDLTLRSFLRQHRNYGRGAYHFHRARARRAGSPLRIEPVSFYTDLVLFPFRAAPRPRAAALSLLLLASQVANIAGYVQERVRA